MIELRLPYFFEKFYFNEWFNYIVKNNKEKLKENIFIGGVYGSFPYTPSNGGFNNNYGRRPLYKDYVEACDLSTMPVTFDCSNLLLNNFDYEDTCLNIILSLNNAGSNSILLSSLDFQNFLKERYGNSYHFISSMWLGLLHEMSADVLNQFIENFDEVELPINFKEEEFSKIKNKKAVIVPIGLEPCNNCDKFNDCLLFEHSSNINFSQKSSFLNCKKTMNYEENYLLEKILYYKNFGFSKFKIILNKGLDNKENNYDNFLIKSFFKKEYYGEILEKKYKEVNKI